MKRCDHFPYASFLLDSFATTELVFSLHFVIPSRIHYSATVGHTSSEQHVPPHHVNRKTKDELHILKDLIRIPTCVHTSSR